MRPATARRARGARPAIAVTVGEPAGIGPELAIRAAWARRAEVNCVLLGDAAFLAMTASYIDPEIKLSALSLQAVRHGGLPHFGPERVTVIDVPLAAHVVPGRLDKENGRSVLATLDAAIEGVGAGWFEAVVTAPLQKSTINDAGVPFSGHTEYFAERTGTPQVVMMLAGQPAAGPTQPTPPPLRVALATTHLPLKDVAAALSRDGLARVLDIIDHDLRAKFGIAAPRILVCGLNPHAGEGGYLGREEIDIIAPAIAAAQARGIDARGPYPADTLFQPKYLQDADCVLAMYHDQGLPVLKYATFGRGVNITLGLPLIRTSVDHGTALDLAAQGLGLADCGSMDAALDTAVAMANASLHLNQEQT
ncbi:4-hydroxythreonine-4-phosphate dehydrogenase PdxA [Duganella sp. BJB488]|uniref:4-hydroxythreonine-4-phosphate dehydrogenase PdxA n=1 Tax=unclassified Duganella TaxID=2636909 RepID=UPI000E344BCE|nr:MULTISPECIES: 4-hydroxythreonine-4-phosphate dehydrogenase PdxA [unclassified Duganella]RFP17027.1 4-hydroxythreonine-4-phosphate dehydrogenase PdxA [Duganella sp. BJB489]RFP20962.1 4-hydroxythreonine-4-phosphate dehydrogenase PdxA [Duganella sp. BJB488]RFP32390.1 4-hydroxythreonine-4-phosphate dehydrogenase PdxA [Duganella sp. BJB480]